MLEVLVVIETDVLVELLVLDTENEVLVLLDVEVLLVEVEMEVLVELEVEDVDKLVLVD